MYHCTTAFGQRYVQHPVFDFCYSLLCLITSVNLKTATDVLQFMYIIRDAILLNGLCRFNYHRITGTVLRCMPRRRQTGDNFIARTWQGESRLVPAAL